MMTILINAAILAMLAATLAYGLMITRRVNRLMAVLAEMGPLVEEFSAAVDKSERSVRDMKSAAVEADAASPAPERPAPADARDAAAALAAQRAPATASAAAPTTHGDAPTFTSRRRQPVAGMTRISGKTELVKSFFERSRSQGEALSQW